MFAATPSDESGSDKTESTMVDRLRNDCVSSGKAIRMLTVVDDYTRECPSIEVDTSLGGWRVRRVLHRIASERGLPEAIVLDDGPEFRSAGVEPPKMRWGGWRSRSAASGARA